MKADFIAVALGSEMHHRLAAPQLVFILVIDLGKRWQLTAKINQQLIPVFPIIQKAEFIYDFGGGGGGSVHQALSLRVNSASETA
jgi:hypothetical protein